MKIYVKKWHSKKNDKEYIALVYNNGGRDKVITFDRYIISDYLGINRTELVSMPVGIDGVIDVYACRKE